MRRMAFVATTMVLALLGGSVPAGAHDDGEDGERGRRGRLLATLVADADAGDFGVGSPDGSFVRIGPDDGATVTMVLAGVTDAAGLPVTAAGNQLTITGLTNGVAFTVSLPFDLTDGRGFAGGTLGLAVGDLLELGGIAAANPSVGVFAVPGVTARVGSDGDSDSSDSESNDGDGSDSESEDGGSDDGEDEDSESGEGGGDDVVIAASRRGGGEIEGRGRIVVSLVGDFDAGDDVVDSAAGSFLVVDGEDGGKVTMRLRGVTDATGLPGERESNRLVITGLRNGAPFSVVFPFALRDGQGRVRGHLDLAAGDVVEVQTMAVDDGASVFAVPGLFVRSDADDDGVGDDDDACEGSPSYMVDGGGCSLGQRCQCASGRRALRACIRTAMRAVKAQIRSTCAGAGACRDDVHALKRERRALLRSCKR